MQTKTLCRKWFSFIPLIIVAAWPLVHPESGNAQVPGPVDQLAALDLLHSESSVPVTSRFRQGVPAFVSVNIELPAEVADDVVLGALFYLERYRELYLLEGPRTQLHLERVAMNETETTLFFGQNQFGVPVHAAQLAVHLSNGAVTGSSGFYQPYLPLPAVPGISSTKAQSQAIGVIGGQESRNAGETRLMYFAADIDGGKTAPAKLAWRVAVAGTQPTSEISSAWSVFVDAHNGEVLEIIETVAFHGPDKEFEITNAVENDDCGGLFGSSRDVWFTERGATSEYPGTAGDLFHDARQSLVNLHRAYDYFFNAFHRHSVDGDDRSVEVGVHASVRNAFVRHDCPDKIFLGDGFQSQDTLTHEYTHIIAKYLFGSSGLRDNQLEEGIADIFGALQDGDWLAGEDGRLLPGEAARCIPGGPGIPASVSRNLADPPVCGHPDRGSDTSAGQSVFGKAAHLITEGSIGPGLTIRALGRSKAPRLFYDVFTTRLTSSANPIGFRDALVEQAGIYVRDGLHRFDSDDVCAVLNAFTVVGIGTPDLDCDGIDDGLPDFDGDSIIDEVDICREHFDPLQQDMDGDESGDACDDDRDGDEFENDVDLCPDVADPEQEDFDDDGIGDACDDFDGDRIVDAIDNCRVVPNPLQENADGAMDGGDACDDDDDNDGHDDDDDNCRTVANEDQADRDEDGVGDLCDNCRDDHNPRPDEDTPQVDTDGDGEGDVCDVDDDNDEVLDDGDNCPTVANPFQIDIDGNFVGLLCDFEEEFLLSGEEVTELKGLLQLASTEPSARIPINPCLSDCPDWLRPEFATRVELELPPGSKTRIVDDSGFELASAAFDAAGIELVKVLQFRPGASSFFRWPLPDAQEPFLGAHAVEAVTPSPPAIYRGSRYFLEVTPPDGFNDGQAIPISIVVENLDVPIPGFDPNQAPQSSKYWGSNPAAWSMDILVIGQHTYEQAILIDFMQNSGKSDASVALARELAAAKLNCHNGVDCSGIAEAINDGDNLLDGLDGTLPFQVKPSSTVGKQMLERERQLRDFNRGKSR